MKYQYIVRGMVKIIPAQQTAKPGQPEFDAMDCPIIEKPAEKAAEIAGELEARNIETALEMTYEKAYLAGLYRPFWLHLKEVK